MKTSRRVFVGTFAGVLGATASTVKGNISHALKAGDRLVVDFTGTPYVMLLNNAIAIAHVKLDPDVKNIKFDLTMRVEGGKKI